MSIASSSPDAGESPPSATATASAPRNEPPVRAPDRRHLQIYAFDPMSTRLSGRRLDIGVRYERLEPGPIGELVHVVDYDGTHDTWYRPVDLDDPAILAQGGLRPTESDPRTHQQVVYAVAMSVIERFERFLGRRFRWRAEHALVMVPHAFEGRNAFFDPDRRAILFGYYAASKDPGPNLPGQVMFTCLSTDIVAHELTHALMSRLRPHFSEATNDDVYAFHEAFADLVALFNHFTFPAVVSTAIAGSQGAIDAGGGLLDLAKDFGQSTGRGEALRSALMQEQTPEAFQAATEPHERGAYFVAGVFDAFLATYRSHISDLLRIATGGTGVLPPGNLHPDLVARVTDEAVKNADRFYGMVVRAIDLLPVVDVTFGDVVRAIVTADRSLYPDDEAHLRGVLVESMRRRGIYPTGISSLADEALAWPAPPIDLSLAALPGRPRIDLSSLALSATRDLDPKSDAGAVRSDEDGDELRGELARGLVAWAKDHAVPLGLDPDTRIALQGMHVVFRQAADRQPRPDVVVQFLQRRRDLEDASVAESDRLPMRAGTTVVARMDGHIDYLVRKPLPYSNPETVTTCRPEWVGIAADMQVAGQARFDALNKWIDDTDRADPLAAWTTTQAVRRLTFASLHADNPVGSG
jgi:hypothetical protein